MGNNRASLYGMSTGASGGSAYLGPLDLVPSLLAAWSTARALSSAMRGDEIFTVQKIGGGNPSQAFSADASSGLAPIASVLTFLGGSSGVFTNLVDQTGGDCSLDGGDNPWDANVINGLPGITDGVSLQSGGEITVVTGATLVAVCTTNVECLFSGGAVDFNPDPDADSAYFELNSGGNVAGGTVDGTLPAGVHVYAMSWREGVRSFSIDGIEQAVTSRDTGAIDTVNTSPAITWNGAGKFVELLIGSPQVTAGDVAALITNCKTAYGIA